MTGTQSDVELVRGAFEAFARGDLETATEALAADVKWYGADREAQEDGCHSRGDALAFIRKASDDGVAAEVVDVVPAHGRIVVVIQTHTPSEWGPQPEPHGEVITVTDGKVTQMVVYPTVEEAFAAVGSR